MQLSVWWMKYTLILLNWELQNKFLLLIYKSNENVLQNICINERKQNKRKIHNQKIPTLFNRDVFRRDVKKAIRGVLVQGRGLSLSEIQVMVNSEEESNLLNKDVKCFLMEEFGPSNLVNKRGKMNHSLFFPAATKVEDVINSFLNINAVKMQLK